MRQQELTRVSAPASAPAAAATAAEAAEGPAVHSCQLGGEQRHAIDGGGVPSLASVPVAAATCSQPQEGRPAAQQLKYEVAEP